jgi:hypothetical protein
MLLHGDLFDQIPQDEQIDSIYTNGAYVTKYSRRIISDRQSHAIIASKMQILGRLKI